MKDVANVAGVSVGTVSNVLNNPDIVSDSVVERVLLAINELGYVRNNAAKALRSGNMPVVGVVVLDLSNPFSTSAARGMEARLAESGCMMIIASSHGDPRQEQDIVMSLETHGVRGIILTPASSDLSAVVAAKERGTPIVLFDSALRPNTIPSVTVDNMLGARMAMEHLLELGHRDIVMINGPDRVSQAAERRVGAGIAVEQQQWGNIRFRVLDVKSFTVAAGREGANMILSSGQPRPTAVFCANDLIAVGVLNELREHGLSIPGDISVVGFDDIPLAEQITIPLTTVRQPTEELGWQAADILLRGRSARDQRINIVPDLIIRNSTAAPSFST